MNVTQKLSQSWRKAAPRRGWAPLLPAWRGPLLPDAPGPSPSSALSYALPPKLVKYLKEGKKTLFCCPSIAKSILLKQTISSSRKELS